MSPFTKKVAWSVAQIVVVLCAFATFFVFAPWLGALPLSDAPPVVAAGLPAGCPAFTVNHGQYHCFWRGTRNQNPMGFWLCALLLFSCWAFLIYTGKTNRGLHLPPLRELFRRVQRHLYEGTPPRQLEVGVGWYTESEWALVKAAATDPERFESTYEEWVQVTETSLLKFLAAGIVANKAYITANELLAWCLAHGRKNNADARAQFVSEKGG